MTKLICAIGALTVASFGFAACTTTTDSTLDTDGGTGSETSTTGDSGGKTDGTTPTTDSGSDGGSCKLEATSGDKTCDTCVEGSCCAVANACAGDAECLALYACIAACPAADAGADAGSCVADCADVHPNGKAGVKALEDCVDAHCSSQCN
jgi:hypothetical protein